MRCGSGMEGGDLSRERGSQTGGGGSQGCPCSLLVGAQGIPRLSSITPGTSGEYEKPVLRCLLSISPLFLSFFLSPEVPLVLLVWTELRPFITVTRQAENHTCVRGVVVCSLLQEWLTNSLAQFAFKGKRSNETLPHCRKPFLKAELTDKKLNMLSHETSSVFCIIKSALVEV